MLNKQHEKTHARIFGTTQANRPKSAKTPMIGIYVFGASHNTAPLSAVAQLIIGKEKRQEAGNELKRLVGVEELVWLSTCNRFEVYFTRKINDDENNNIKNLRTRLCKQLIKWLKRHSGVQQDFANQACYLLSNRDTSTHLMRLSSGLDSLILGESQILGQVKTAFQQAQKEKQTGAYLSRLFSHAIMVGKHVRSNTQLGQQPGSYASLANKLILRLYQSISDKKILMIGGGEMIKLMVKHFGNKGAADLSVAMRNLKKAALFAQSHRVNAISIEQAVARLADYDIVISCTGSSQLILNHNTIKQSMRKRKNKLTCMIDLALPPDIASKAGEIEGVYYYDLEHFSGWLEEKRGAQIQDIQEAEAIVQNQADAYTQWIKTRKFIRLIQAIKQQADETQKKTVEEIVENAKNKKWGSDFALHKLGKELSKKLTLPVVERINEAAVDEGNYEILRAAERLYNVDAGQYWQNRKKTTEAGKDNKGKAKGQRAEGVVDQASGKSPSMSGKEAEGQRAERAEEASAKASEASDTAQKTERAPLAGKKPAAEPSAAKPSSVSAKSIAGGRAERAADQASGKSLREQLTTAGCAEGTADQAPDKPPSMSGKEAEGQRAERAEEASAKASEASDTAQKTERAPLAGKKPAAEPSAAKPSSVNAKNIASPPGKPLLPDEKNGQSADS